MEDTLAGLAQVAFPEATSPGGTYPQGGVAEATVSHTYTFTEEVDEEGVYEVTAADRATNERRAGFRLTRDADLPQVWLDAPHRIYSGDTAIPVTWGATDGSSGVARYDLQVRVEDGEWSDWLTDTLDTEATYVAEEGGWFTFRVTATDNVSNAESAEATSSLAVVRKYYYHGGRRVAQQADGVVYYLHGDHLGSTALVTSQTSNVISRQLYHPYGTVRWQDGTLPTDFGFTGQRHDGSTGLIFMHARYYHPALGRFVSADSIVPEPGNPQQWSRYTYAGNSPLVYVDPSGHFVILPALALVAVVAGGAAIVDWSFQVSDNHYNKGLSWGDAVYHENLNEGEMIQAAAVGGGAAATAVTVGPALVTMAGYDLMAVGAAAGSTTIWTAGTSTAVAGTAAYTALWTVDQAGGSGEWYDAINRGNRMHYDQMNGSDGAYGPSQLQDRYLDTTFDFARRGEAGVDVTYVGGRHPSLYPNSSWPAGANYADIKPNTASGFNTFYSEISTGKLPQGTIPIPYNPDTMQIEPWHAFYSPWPPE